jgi:RNA polymerase sigma factor (sigma-70 family)
MIRQTNHMADAVLWQDFIRGDEQAFASLFRKYHKSLCHYAYKIIPDKELVKDCVQEVFIYLWQNRKKLVYTDAIQYYLIKSLRGKLLRMLNKRAKHRMETLAGDAFTFEFTFSFEDTLILEQARREQQEQLLRALNQLSKRQREIIYLKFFNNLSYEQIADITGLTYQVTRNYVFQAIKVLRQKVDLVTCYLLLIAGVSTNATDTLS